MKYKRLRRICKRCGERFTWVSRHQRICSPCSIKSRYRPKGIKHKNMVFNRRNTKVVQKGPAEIFKWPSSPLMRNG